MIKDTTPRKLPGSMDEDSGSNGEADAADTANGAEPEDDAERREESSDTDSGDGGR